MIQAESPEPSVEQFARTIGDDTASAPGPTLIVIGGLHANEPAGIEAAERLHASIASGSLTLNAGRLVSLRGNLAALSASTPKRDRYIDEDLNRAFVGEVPPEGERTVEQRERAELSQLLDSIVGERNGPVYLLDLHTVSSDSPPFMVLEDSLPARRFASSFPLPKILGLEEELTGLLIDDATHRLGTVSCIVESGRHDDPRSADVHEALLLIALEALAMAAPGTTTRRGEQPRAVAAEMAGAHTRRFYDFRQRVVIRDESFTMRSGATAFSRVRAGQTVLATERSRLVTAEANGLLFMPNRQESRRIGDDGCFVVERVGEFWLRLSAFLRTREVLHRLLPALLPGIRRHPDEAHTILVAPEYAAVLRRQFLHMMGYRLVRWQNAPHLPPHRRLARGIIAVTRSFVGILAGIGRGGEKGALSDHRDTDWIARRRHLDVTPPDASRQ